MSHLCAVPHLNSFHIIRNRNSTPFKSQGKELPETAESLSEKIVKHMDQIQWEHFPEIAVHHQARTWLLRESQLGLAPNTLKAYGQAMNDFLAFWVAAVDAMRIGDFAGTRDPRAYGPDFGKSLMPRSKYQLLASLRRFFRDLQDFPYNLPRSLSR